MTIAMTTGRAARGPSVYYVRAKWPRWWPFAPLAFVGPRVGETLKSLGDHATPGPHLGTDDAIELLRPALSHQPRLQDLGSLPKPRQCRRAMTRGRARTTRRAQPCSHRLLGSAPHRMLQS